MSDGAPQPAVPAAAPAAPAVPSARGRRIGAVLLVLAGLAALAIGIALAVSPMLRWTARASFARPEPASAWRFVPANKPILAILDARAIFASAAWAELRPDLNALARRHGMDLGLAERNASFLVVGTDGRGFAEGAATGPRLSPLLLPRFDQHWQASVVAGQAAVTDGSAVIVPREPGVVAFAFAETRRDATPVLEAALAGPGTPVASALALDGAALRIVAVPDDILRRRMAASFPRDAARLAVAIERLDARILTTDVVSGEIALTYPTEDAASVAVSSLQQLDQALSTGLMALLLPFLGEDAAILGKLPPFDAEREGRIARITFTATPEQIRALIAEAPGPA